MSFTDYQECDRVFGRVIKGVFGADARVTCHRDGDSYWAFDFEDLSLHIDGPLEHSPWVVSRVCQTPQRRDEPDNWDVCEITSRMDFLDVLTHFVQHAALARLEAVRDALSTEAFAEEVLAEQKAGWL